jgi:phage shock protein PspC (stress-responsive transcriptional regulator)
MTETTTQTTATPPPPRRLERVKEGRLLTGVAAGFGRYLGVDANVVRIVFVVLACLGGAGFFAYFAAAVLLPGEGGTPPIIKRLRLPWRSGTGRAVLGASLIAIAIAAVLGATDVLAWDTAAGLAILALGAVLVVAAFAGGAPWLIVPALLLAGGVAFLQAADVHLRGGWGDRDVAVASAAELNDRYDLAAGRLRLDLQNLRLADGEVRSVHARVGMGDLVIRVPQGITVETNARSGAGKLDVLGRHSEGLDVTRTTTRAAGSGGGVLQLDADVGLGRVVVVRAPAPMAELTHRGWSRL